MRLLLLLSVAALLYAQDGHVSVMVRRGGYLDGYGYMASPTDGALRVQLVPQAVITGHVFDENGLPVRGARVDAMRARGRR